MTDVSADAESEQGRSLKKIGLHIVTNYGIVLAAILLFVILAFASPAFATKLNFSILLEQWASVGIMAAGMTLILICGGFDLSAGSAFAFCGVIAVIVANATSVPVGIVAGILTGVVIGIVNGTLVTALRINPFIATLSTGIIITGLIQGVTGGEIKIPNNSSFADIGQGEIWGFGYPVFFLIGIVIVYGFVLHRTVLGRQIYAVGGNAEAARLAGIRVSLVRLVCYVLIGAAAGLAGTIQAAHVASADPGAGGLNQLFDVFAVVIVGGTSLIGGMGAMWRTVVGIAILAMIGNGFVLLNVSSTNQQVFFGLIILVAVAIDSWTKTGRGAGAGA
jgi:ribose transport system permease protein